MPKSSYDGLTPSLSDQRRLQLTNAVIECVSELGFDGASMRTIAKRAGVSTGMLLHYFGNKRDLVNAAIADALRRSAEQIDRNTAAEYGPRRIEGLVSQYFKDDGEDPSKSFMLQVRAASLHEPDLRRQLGEFVEDGRQKLQKSVQAGIEDGQFRSDLDSKVAADLIFGVMMGWSSITAVSPDAISQAGGRAISVMLIKLLTSASTGTRDHDDGSSVSSGRPTTELIRADLMADPRLSADRAATLADAFDKMYELAATADEPS
jgi:TetR/AcrR family fatty acid metabolism transcriptional regulator